MLPAGKDRGRHGRWRDAHPRPDGDRRRRPNSHRDRLRVAANASPFCGLAEGRDAAQSPLRPSSACGNIKRLIKPVDGKPNVQEGEWETVLIVESRRASFDT